MHLGENQLSRSLIGLSPLPTGHPPGFQPWWVRSSTRSYPRFNLPMGRSLRFGSTACDSDALFRLAFPTASPHGLTLPHTVTRRLFLQKARRHITAGSKRRHAMPRGRVGLFLFRSPLLRESRLFSLPVGTEMFPFPTLPPPALCVQAGAMGHYAHSGFPIRKSPDRSLVADSPGLIAGSYVLLRLLVPRHSPCALINLATTDDARVHCAVLKIRAVPASRRPPRLRQYRPC